MHVDLPHNELGNDPADWQEDRASTLEMELRVAKAVEGARERRTKDLAFARYYVDICHDYVPRTGKQLSASDKAKYESCLNLINQSEIA
jgi:hypothetical protein